MSTLSKNIQSKVTPEIRFFFDKEKHTYWLDGKRMTGVTTILSVIAKNSLIQWAANETIKYILENGKIKDKDFILISKGQLDEARTAHTRKRDKSADIGTMVHKAIELWIGGNPKNLCFEHIPKEQIGIAEKMFDNFIKWADENKVEFLESEKRVYDEDKFYAGTLDFLCKIDNDVYVGDIKTSSGIYPEMFWQTAAYQNALERLEPSLKISANLIVNIRKDGKTEVQKSYYYKENLEAFFAALVIYRRLQSHN